MTKVKTAPDALHQEHVSSTLESESQYFSIPARIPVTLQGSRPIKITTTNCLSGRSLSHTCTKNTLRTSCCAGTHFSTQITSNADWHSCSSQSSYCQVVPVLNALFKGNTSPTRRIFNASSTSREIISEPGNPLKHRSPEPFNRLPNHMTSTSASPAEQVAPTSQPARIPLPLVAPVKTHSEKSGTPAPLVRQNLHSSKPRVAFPAQSHTQSRMLFLLHIV